MLSLVDAALVNVHDPAVPTPRDQARARTLGEITRIGRAHLASSGAAGLSLRAVARDLGVVSSAIYRYVPSRDELLTLLVVDAYSELGEAVSAADASLPREDLAGRWRAVAGSVRHWALAEPSRYGLVFGTPVPGYHAPVERTTGPGTRVIVLLLRLAVDAEAAGARPVAAAAAAPGSGSLQEDAERVRAEYGLALSDEMLTAAVLVWVALFGAVSFEVFGQFGPDTFSDPREMFTALVEVLAVVLGLQATRVAP